MKGGGGSVSSGGSPPLILGKKKKNCRRKKSQQGNRYKSALPPPFSSRSGSATGKEGETVGFVVPICRCPAYNHCCWLPIRSSLLLSFFLFDSISFCFSDWAYEGVYDNSQDSTSYKSAKGFAYHQGPVSQSIIWYLKTGLFLCLVAAPLSSPPLKEGVEGKVTIISTP